MDDGHAVRVAGDVRGAGHGLRNDIIAGALGVGSRLAVGGKGGVDDVGLQFLDLLIAEAKPADDAGAEALHEDVSRFDQLRQDLFALRIGQIQRDRLLPAVRPGAGQAAAVEKRAETAAVVTDDRAFHFDHFRAVIGKQGSGTGSGSVQGQVDHTQSVKHSHNDTSRWSFFFTLVKVRKIVNPQSFHLLFLRGSTVLVILPTNCFLRGINNLYP